MDSEGESIRKRIKALRSEAHAALSELGGTSNVVLAKLVDSWNQAACRVWFNQVNILGLYLMYVILVILMKLNKIELVSLRIIILISM